MNSQDSAASQFRKPDPKFTTLATKSSQKSTHRKYGSGPASGGIITGRRSPHSPSQQVIPNDLDVVMGGSDLNFKKKKTVLISEAAGVTMHPSCETS